jgi:hypothetical protein
MLRKHYLFLLNYFYTYRLFTEDAVIPFRPFHVMQLHRHIEARDLKALSNV